MYVTYGASVLFALHGKRLIPTVDHDKALYVLSGLLAVAIALSPSSANTSHGGHPHHHYGHPPHSWYDREHDTDGWR